jgi:hypothetical protein
MSFKVTQRVVEATGTGSDLAPIKAQHGPVTVIVHGTFTGLDLDIQGSVLPGDANPGWTDFVTAVAAGGTHILYAEIAELKFIVNAISSGTVYVDICYTAAD